MTPACLKIQWAFCLFRRPTRDAVRINHRRSHIGVPQHHLYCPYVIMSLQKMRSETVPKSMRFNPFSEFCHPCGFFQRVLNLRFMQVISSTFCCSWYRGQFLLWKKPLPAEKLTRPFQHADTRLFSSVESSILPLGARQ